MRAVLAAVAALALVSTAIPADASQAELARAQARANRAARELAAAKTQLAELEQRIGGLEVRVNETAQALGSLRTAMKERAIQQFIDGSSDGGIVLDEDLAASARASALARFVSLGDDDAIDEYRRTTEDLGVARAELERARSRSAELVDETKAKVDDAFAELRKLERLEAERKAREERQRRAAAASRRASTVSTGAARSFVATGGWMCPVQGPRSFTNDWGQPRSGGRRHQGTDILAPRGTPVVAVVAGVARGHNSRLGGISFYLNGVDGNTYFGTHLNSLSGASGRVEQGTVLGYVGNTGNARGGPPHLHFEIHPGGGRPVNPYPTLRANC